MSGPISINSDLCENEQVCADVCPEDVFRIDHGSVVISKARACTLCFKCAEACPSGAIELDY